MPFHPLQLQDSRLPRLVPWPTRQATRLVSIKSRTVRRERSQHSDRTIKKKKVFSYNRSQSKWIENNRRIEKLYFPYNQNYFSRSFSIIWKPGLTH